MNSITIQQCTPVYHGDNRPAEIRFHDDLNEARILSGLMMCEVEKLTIQKQPISEARAEIITFIAGSLHDRLRSLENRLVENDVI